MTKRNTPDSNALTIFHTYRKERRQRRESGEADVSEKHYIKVCVEDVGVDKAEDLRGRWIDEAA